MSKYEKAIERSFKCVRCDVRFKAMALRYEASMCPKCRDSEYVERADYTYGYQGD